MTGLNWAYTPILYFLGLQLYFNVFFVVYRQHSFVRGECYVVQYYILVLCACVSVLNNKSH